MHDTNNILFQQQVHIICKTEKWWERQNKDIWTELQKENQKIFEKRISTLCNNIKEKALSIWDINIDKIQ